MNLLPTINNEGNNFTVVTLHYSADPDKNEEWVKEARKGMPPKGWDREYEISYEIFGGKTFFPEFQQFNVHKSEYQPRETLYRGWDYGFHRPCCLISKLNPQDQWCWLEVILGKDEGIMAFGKRIRNFCITRYPGAYYVDVGDPQGEAISDKSEKTSVQILETLGIYVRSRKQPIKQGAEIIRQKLQMRVDGKPGLIVHPKLTPVIDGFKGGLHYPEVREGQPQKEFYEKDGYYDHIFDAGRYLATDMFTVIGEQQMPNVIVGDKSGPEFKYQMGRSVDESSDNDLESLANDLSSSNMGLGEF